MDCDICFAVTRGRRKYCDLCHDIISNDCEYKARVDTLKRIRRADGFHCEYTDKLLNLTDSSNPYYVNFDHPVPGIMHVLKASIAIVNESKASMTSAEFPIVVRETVNHWDTGEPFNRNIVPFEAWGKGRQILKATNARLVDMALAPKLVDDGLLVPPGSGRACWICERYAVVRKQLYCPRCRRLVRRGVDEPYPVMAAALKKAYNRELDTFLCYHLGVPLDLFDIFSPFYLCYDHLVPKMKGNIVVSSMLANMMKTDTDEQEWHAYYRMLDSAMRGGFFDSDKLEFKYWKRQKKIKGRKVA